MAEHQLEVVETDDFRKAMEAASGKDLKWFFDQWVYKAGHPELKVRWRYEDDDKTVRVRIEQTQKVDEQTPLFRLPTTLEIAEAADQVRTIPIVIDGASQEFIIPAATRPKMVQIDPKGWLIKQLDFEKSDAEYLFQLENESCVLGRLDAARPWPASRGAGPGSRGARPCRETREEPAGPPAVGRADGQRRGVVPRRPDRGGQGSRGAGARRGDRRPGPAERATRSRSRSSAPRGTTPRKPTARVRLRCEGWPPGRSMTPRSCSRPP